MADTESADATTNEVVYTSASVAARWASIEPMAGNERLTAARVNADTTHKVTLRYYDGLTTKHWFQFGSRRLEILGIVNLDERNIQQACECREVV